MAELQWGKPKTLFPHKLCEFGWMFRRIKSKIIFTIRKKKVSLSFVLAASFYSVDESGVQLRLQSRFSGTQKPITGAEPISYLPLKPLFTGQVQLQYFVQFVDCVPVWVHGWRGQPFRDLRETLLHECKKTREVSDRQLKHVVNNSSIWLTCTTDDGDDDADTSLQ